MTTSTSKETLKSALNQANPNKLPDALAQVDLGDVLTVQEYDTGTITATDTVALPGGALLVQSAQVVTSGTAASVGHYLPGNSGSTPLLPPGGANVAVGICKVPADGASVIFPNTVTRAIVRYIKKPAVALTADFNRA